MMLGVESQSVHELLRGIERRDESALELPGHGSCYVMGGIVHGLDDDTVAAIQGRWKRDDAAWLNSFDPAHQTAERERLKQYEIVRPPPTDEQREWWLKYRNRL